jgi:hypothetical protein
VSEDLRARVERSVLGFKFWPDEPGSDSMCTWTENHHILFASGAYLAGQMFPGHRFANSGHSGREKMALNRPRILRWLDLRLRTGFSEWLSHVYYDEDLTALLSLVDFCEDPEIAGKAEAVVHLILLDVALHSFRGVFGSSHGRSYENTKKWAAQEGTTDTAKLLFGMGCFSIFDNMSAPVFALSRYRVPPILVKIAEDLALRPETVICQRMGLLLREAERWGLRFDNLEDGMTFLTLEAYAHPRTFALVTRMFDAFGWWENEFFRPLKPMRGLIRAARAVGLLAPLARLMERDACRNTREQVNVFTYRTPDYMLSTAQDYRKGYGGDQQHIWQATLGPGAVCFTTHPARVEGLTPNYWAGNGLLPRAAQVKNVTIVVYKIEKILAAYVPVRCFFTHAWLPRDQFDEIREEGGWYFARKGEGYLALRSQQPCRWNEDSARSEDRGRELVAEGAENIWICEMGRSAVDGSFDAFRERILAAGVAYERLRVRYASPSQGVLEFGWQGDLLQDGKKVELGGYQRYDTPYGSAEYGAGMVEIRCDEERMVIGSE